MTTRFLLETGGGDSVPPKPSGFHPEAQVKGRKVAETSPAPGRRLDKRMVPKDPDGNVACRTPKKTIEIRVSHSLSQGDLRV